MQTAAIAQALLLLHSLGIIWLQSVPLFLNLDFQLTRHLLKWSKYNFYPFLIWQQYAILYWSWNITLNASYPSSVKLRESRPLDPPHPETHLISGNVYSHTCSTVTLHNNTFPRTLCSLERTNCTEQIQQTAFTLSKPLSESAKLRIDILQRLKCRAALIW